MAAQVLIGAVMVSGAGLLLWWALFSDRRGTRVQQALQSISEIDEASFRQIALAPSARERVVVPFGQRLAGRARRFTPAGSIDAMHRRIALAGAQERWTVERLLSAKVMVAFGLFVVVFLLALAAGSVLWMLLAFGIGVVGYVAPDGVLDHTAEARQKRIQDEMPDVIDQIMISVQSGLSFDGALDRAAATGRGPFAQELARVVQDIRLGMARGDALTALSDRTDVAELDEFVIAMNQADAYGLSIAQVLRVQSEELREKRRQRAEERSRKIPVKMTMPLVFCIFPCIFIATLGPALIQAFRII